MNSKDLNQFQTGDILLEDYRVVRRLGQGGMGTVYLVRSESTDTRFAVKRVIPELSSQAHHRRVFLRELLTWSDLPRYPHIAEFRFFKTMGDEILIFSEYVDGGSLDTWIESGRLRTIEPILNVAMQMTWGLNVIHEQGIAHQDFKPGNVLLTSDGLVKITDFGLAKAWADITETASRFEMRDSSGCPDSRNRSPISSTYMTPAYCSPEQAEQSPISRRTDIWSWGLCILQMFTGRTTWRYGVVAPEILDQVLSESPGNLALPLPPELGILLRKCFQYDPAQRWQTVTELTEQLYRVYRRVTGTDLLLHAPEYTPRRQSEIQEEHWRQHAGYIWPDPVPWLNRALTRSGMNMNIIGSIFTKRLNSLKAHIIKDLILYEETQRLFETLIQDDPRRCKVDLTAYGTVCENRSHIHRVVGDLPGAVQLHDRAIAAFKTLLKIGRSDDLFGKLGNAHMNRGSDLYQQRKFQESIRSYKRAVAVFKKPVADPDHQDGFIDLAMAYMNLSNALWSQGENNAAIRYLKESIKSGEQLVYRLNRPDKMPDLAMSYGNMANIVGSLKKHRESLVWHDKAIDIWTKLVYGQRITRHSDTLALTYMNKANTLWILGENRDSLVCYDRAIGIYRRLVDEEGRSELAQDLALTFVNKSYALRDAGQNTRAIQITDKAIDIFTRLIRLEGRKDLRYYLTVALNSKAQNQKDLGQYDDAILSLDASIRTYEELAGDSRHRWDPNKLAGSYVNKADIYREKHRYDQAIDAYNVAIGHYRKLVQESGRIELQGEWANAVLKRAHALIMSGRADECVPQAGEAYRILQREYAKTHENKLRETLVWAAETMKDILKPSENAGTPDAQ
ncbi:serine/threonine protein kinase [bacterium]|nr:serine/threonine protein kinase [candidate division CSSED10-310 bacterium]